jgi:heme/copper-type cytochrome/quinol oxidase subunit 2
MKSSISNLQTIILISVLSVILLFGVVSGFYNEYYVQTADAKKGRHESKATTDSAVSPLAQQQQQQPIIPGAIQLSAKELPSGYRWINTTNGVINPTMNFNVGTTNTIQLQNPTDSKHQLVIDDSNGNQFATSGDIVFGRSSQFSFKPVSAGTFEYHCIYHPTTMKGTIQVMNVS